jgi:hypothetical protein
MPVLRVALDGCGSLEITEVRKRGTVAYVDTGSRFTLVPNSSGATVARTFRVDKLARHVLQAKRDARKLRATHD